MTERTPDELNRRTYLKFAGGAAATAALAGCSGDGVETETPMDDGDGMDGDDGTDTPEPQEDFEVTVTQSQMATTLDPHNHRETSTDNILLQAYDRVVFRDAEGRIIERLATDWDRVEDFAEDGKVIGLVGSGVDAYRFSGSITGVSVDGEASLSIERGI